MNYEYITALMLPEGSEAPLQAFLNTMEDHYRFAYPLPAMIPLAAFSAPFPRDRVDRTKLRELGSMSFSEVVTEEKGLILKLSDPLLVGRAADCLRGIHDKEKPVPLAHPLFSWEGLLLQPQGFPGYCDGISSFPAVPEMNWHTYRFVLLKITWRENRPWWEHLEWEILWNIRKAKQAK